MLCCVVLCCVVLCCVVLCCVVVWCGVVWCGVTCCGILWYVVVLCYVMLGWGWGGVDYIMLEWDGVCLCNI